MKIPIVPIRNMSKLFTHKGISKRRFHEHFSLTETTKVFLYQGDIKPARGVEQLLDVMERLSTPGMALVFMGPIPDEGYKEHFKQRLRETVSLQGRVFYKTRVARDELLSWTASADLGIAPLLNTRKNNYYCLPNKLFEYIQAEVPCAVSDFPEMRKIVEQYNIGFTFDSANIDDMTQKLTAFLESPELGRQYVEHASVAKQQLCWENEQHKLLELYDTLLNRGLA